MKRIALMAALLAPMAMPATAATLTFTDPQSFAAALGGTATAVDSYENVALGTVVLSGTNLNGVTYNFSGGRTGQVNNAFNRIGTRSLEALADNTGPNFFIPGNSVTVTFAGPQRAIGGFFNANLSPVDQLFLAVPGTILTGGGPGDRYDIETLFFLGIISDTPFESATFGALAGTTGVFNFDNLTSVAYVPEPASWAMMVVGFGCAGWAMRRRKRSLRAASVGI